MGFEALAKEMHWKDDGRAQLRVRPKSLGTIEKLEQEMDQAEGAGKVETRCLQLGNQMEPKIISDDGLDIAWRDDRIQSVRLDRSAVWTWDVSASERGSQHLYLSVTAYVLPESGGGRSRTVTGRTLFDDNIYVDATLWEDFSDFVASRWLVLVPILLTILSAIIIPFVLPWWKRRTQPSEPRDRPSPPEMTGGFDRLIDAHPSMHPRNQAYSPECVENKNCRKFTVTSGRRYGFQGCPSLCTLAPPARFKA
jgi:hypothetical protein